jgi:hypothetical protein
MPHKRMTVPRLAAIMALGFAIAVGIHPGASLGKGGDGGDHGPGDHGNGDHGNGGGGQGAQGNQGNGRGDGHAGGGAQTSGNAGSASGPAAVAGIDLGGQEGSASGLMLRKAVVALNATYAVPHRSSHPAVDARIRQMAVYDHMMLSALGMPTDTAEQREARDRAITDARIQLAAATNRRLNSAAVSRIDALLGLPATDPQLGIQ